jgi:hypothetical protein
LGKGKTRAIFQAEDNVEVVIEKLNNVDDMKLFRLVHGFQDFLKILSDLKKLTECSEANALVLNIDKCKSITFPRLRHPVEYSYMLGCVILDCGDLGVIMNNRMPFTEHVDIAVGIA